MRLRRPMPRHSFAAHPPAAVAGQCIGLLGGSFNPAHDGHRLISVIARRRLGLTQVWWLVSPANPLKDQRDLSGHAERIGHASGVASAPWIKVTGFEAVLGSPYTVDTLAFLRMRYPGVRFVWLMGADNLVSVHRWRRWRSIFAAMPVAVVDRPGWHLAASASRAARTFAHGRVPESKAKLIPQRRAPAWTLLTGPLSKLSSTALRADRRQKR